MVSAKVVSASAVAVVLAAFASSTDVTAAIAASFARFAKVAITVAFCAWLVAYAFLFCLAWLLLPPLSLGACLPPAWPFSPDVSEVPPPWKGASFGMISAL